MEYRETVRELEVLNIKELAPLQDSPWLHGSLILPLNENGEGFVNGYILRYSRKKDSNMKGYKMNDKEFNLLYEPWIKTYTKHGENTEYSILNVFKNAHHINSLAELPTQDFAILRLLLAILHGFRKAAGRVHSSIR